MVSRAEGYAVFDDIYFESARGYAVDRGAKAADATSASARVEIDGKTYSVVFSKSAAGGTVFGVEDAQVVRDRLLNPAKMKAHYEGKMDSQTFEVGGVTFDGDPNSEETMRKIGLKIMREVDHRLKIDEQSYHYVIEEAEWVAGRNEFCQDLLEETGLLEVEYIGARKWGENLSVPWIASRYMDEEVWPDLQAHMGENLAQCIRAVISGGILEVFWGAIALALRPSVDSTPLQPKKY